MSQTQDISLKKCPDDLDNLMMCLPKIRSGSTVPYVGKIFIIIHCAGNEVREEDSGTANGGSKKSKDFFH